MKTCSKCGETKALEGFYVRPRCRDGYSNQCRKCEIQQNRTWRQGAGVKDRLNEMARARGPRSTEEIRRNRLWTWHKLTTDQYEAILARQGGACAICGTTDPGGRGGFHVDHDHACCPNPRSCGQCVRGLLCSRCNPMLGMAKDDVETLRAAVAYLDNAALSALGAIGSV